MLARALHLIGSSACPSLVFATARVAVRDNHADVSAVGRAAASGAPWLAVVGRRGRPVVVAEGEALTVDVQAGELVRVGDRCGQ